MDPMSHNLVFGIIVAVSIAVCITFAYWQVKLVKRIHDVSRSQHTIPENVFWLKRARMAIEADEICQKLVRSRNIWAIIFLFIIVVVAVLMSSAFMVIG